MIEIHYYADGAGKSPFFAWLRGLDDVTRARVTRAVSRLGDGNTSNVKALGGGLNELKIDFGPGFRVYFAWKGRAAVLILGGGSKKQQQRDIAQARERWSETKHRPR